MSEDEFEVEVRNQDGKQVGSTIHRVRASRGKQRRIAQWFTATVLLIGLGLMAAGGFSLIVDAQVYNAEENMRPEDFDFVVTLTPPPTQGLRLSQAPTRVVGPPAPTATASPLPTQST